MDSIFVHPAIVHLPIGAALLLPLAALVVTVQISRKAWPENTFALVVLLSAAATLAGFVAGSSGEDAEHAHAAAGQVWRAAVHAHEEAADKFIWTMTASTIVAIGAWLSKKDGLRVLLRVLVVALLLGNVALALWTGHLGGQLVHPRFESTFSAPN